MSVKEKLWRVHEQQIQRTKPEAHILAMKIRIAKITKQLQQAMGCEGKNIYIHTRALKHLYDKKPAEEFDFLIDHLEAIVRAPDFLYRNRDNKTGSFCVVKEIEHCRYIVILEEIWIVTAFRVRDEKYLRNYDLLRSWRDGAHSS
jgi:hypothetical protein